MKNPGPKLTFTFESPKNLLIAPKNRLHPRFIKLWSLGWDTDMNIFRIYKGDFNRVQANLEIVDIKDQNKNFCQHI